jgi:hypothetical protein
LHKAFLYCHFTEIGKSQGGEVFHSNSGMDLEWSLLLHYKFCKKEKKKQKYIVNIDQRERGRHEVLQNRLGG